MDKDIRKTLVNWIDQIIIDSYEKSSDRKALYEIRCQLFSIVDFLKNPQRDKS